MALIFMDGFDAYAANGATCQTQMIFKWGEVSSTAATFTAGRFAGSLGLDSSTTGFTTPAFGSQTTWTLGFAFFRATGANNFVVASFIDTSTTQCSLFLNSSNIFELRRSTSVILATGTTTIATSTWYYVEVQVTINNSTGSMELRLDGSSPEASVTNVNTQSSANATANKINIGANSQYYDDLYLLDSTGSLNNDFLGDVSIDTILPDAAGDFSEWSLGAGSGANYERVNEQAVDDDASYVFTKTVNALDMYNFPELSSVKSNIAAVSANITLRKDRAGGVTVAPAIRALTTNYNGTAGPVYDNYLKTIQIYELYPPSGNEWTISGVNTSQYGPRLVG